MFFLSSRCENAEVKFANEHDKVLHAVYIPENLVKIWQLHVIATMFKNQSLKSLFCAFLFT